MSLTTGSNPNLTFQHSPIKSRGNTNINITNQLSDQGDLNDSLAYNQVIDAANGTSSVNPYSILERNTVLDALYDSDARYDPPRCHPHTRTAVLNHIRSWATSEDSRPVMWIRGGAGAGKSAIAQTLSEGWATEDLLAASFYFFRTANGRNEKKYFIATLAYQMTASIPGYRSLVEDAIRQIPRIFERNLRTQMQTLIINPLQLVTRSQSATIGARLVVIDGLDECCHSYAHQTFEQQQKEILEAIHLASSEKGFPLRFLIASRPERQIREMFDYGLLESISSRTVLDDTQNPSADIEIYLQCSFAEIKRIHSHLGPSWPSKATIKQLVMKASGHFIYAAVVVRYLSSPRTDPNAWLTALMNATHSDVDQPFAELDALYTHILESVAPQSLPIIMDIFALMIYVDIGDEELVCFSSDIAKMSPYFIEKFLFMSPGQLSLHLVDLHSILDIPSNVLSKRAPISFLHASFSEFLTQSFRSQRFFIEKERASSRLLSISIRHLFIQLLAADSGRKKGYIEVGLPFQVGQALRLTQPDNDDLEALRAMLSQDENDFVQYVQKAGLSHLGTTRRSMEQIRWLYHSDDHSSPRRPMVLAVLKRHPVQGFVPIDPARDDMYPEDYGGVLDWFCDISEEIGPRSKTHHPSGEPSFSAAHTTGSRGELPENLQPVQPRRSKRRLELES